MCVCGPLDICFCFSLCYLLHALEQQRNEIEPHSHTTCIEFIRYSPSQPRER